jgi:hypothetical protein
MTRWLPRLSIWPNLGGHPAGRFLPLWVALVVGMADEQVGRGPYGKGMHRWIT